MDLRLLYAILLTIAPVTELRIGLPLAIKYSIDNNVPWIFCFLLIIFVNILLVFFVFLILDRVYLLFKHSEIYQRFVSAYIKKFRTRINNFEKKHNQIGFYALMLFVAVPFPGTGAWSGCILSWILGLDRKKSTMAIIAGVMIAGILVLLASLGVISLFS
ncbi:MAG TPA: small multi-drug export protein [Candidatus Nanoarchaeia archaeon]|nr:small multi-drug export protein [Candidatus Nanoarchaeia archaeon]